MKTIKNTMIALVVALAIACDDFIDLAPISNANVEEFFQNEEDLEQAVVAAYAALQSRGEYARNFIYFMEARSDNSIVEDITKAAGEEGNLDLFREATTNSYLESSWNVCYTGIQRCNMVLSRIDGIDMDASLREIRKGEVLFLRALTYFNMVRMWGDIPVVIEEVTNVADAYDHIRNSTEEVYAQIIADLQAAIDDLPDSQADVGRVTRGAALTLLGKVYLTRQNWAEAVNTLSQVQGYTLLPTYADVFDVDNENNAESIFEVQFVGGADGEGSLFLRLHTPINNTSLLGGVGAGGVGDNLPSRDLVEAFTTGDLRSAVTVDSLDDGRYHTNKFNGIPVDTNDEDNNFIVLRYADVLLMLAEAQNEVGYVAGGPAFDNLNQIRTRAGLPAFTATDLADQESFRQAVWRERRLELAFEFHRWFDLVRTNQYLAVMNAYDEDRAPLTVQPHQGLFPVPQSQIDISPNNITQNPGY